jgi:site-specific DNA-methyltransferase (adenine-specific)
MKDIFNDNVSLKTETPAFAKHVLPAVPSSEVYLEDCVKALKRFNDNHFDLAIVDPPYGIGEASAKIHTRHHSQKKYTIKDWDNEPPNEEYFSELIRVSKNQIVWGANHFIERINKNSSCWIVWDKDGFGDQADCEIAWTSFKTAVRKFKYTWNGFRQQDMKNKEVRFHPTQKPVALYDWLLNNYAKPNDLILDTHLGSGSSRIASYKGGFNFVGFEIDQEYYEKQEKRFNDFKSQLRLF